MSLCQVYNESKRDSTPKMKRQSTTHQRNLTFSLPFATLCPSPFVLISLSICAKIETIVLDFSSVDNKRTSEYRFWITPVATSATRLFPSPNRSTMEAKKAKMRDLSGWTKDGVCVLNRWQHSWITYKTEIFSFEFCVFNPLLAQSIKTSSNEIWSYHIIVRTWSEWQLGHLNCILAKQWKKRIKEFNLLVNGLKWEWGSVLGLLRSNLTRCILDFLQDLVEIRHVWDWKVITCVTILGFSMLISETESIDKWYLRPRHYVAWDGGSIRNHCKATIWLELDF